MTIFTVFTLVVLATALLPAIMILRNLPAFRLPEEDLEPIADDQVDSISVLIPARDEAAGIRDSVTAALASRHVCVQVVVYDDGSTDGTDQIVNRIAETDDRVVLVEGVELPASWNGKQHACWQLSKSAKHDVMVFLDADVRLQPDGLAILRRRQLRTGVELLSAFPKQVTDTFWEKRLIPMMYYILLGYLPFDRMRKSTSPGFAAGCGQCFMTSKSDYETAGTHAEIRGSRHDGVKLPRAYREAGLMTDVVDGSNLAQCRMYADAGQVLRGVLKNATEGIANPRLIALFTWLLIGGSVLPVIGTIWVLLDAGAPETTLPLLPFWVLSLLAVTLSRGWLSTSLKRPAGEALWHPFAVLVFVVLQWVALFNHWTGRQVAWRGRIEHSTKAP